MPEVNIELQAVLTRWLNALASKDFATVANLLSSDEAMIYIGTDAREAWHGSDIRRVVGKHLEDMPGFTFSFDPESVVAYSVGSVGWGTATATAVFDDLEPVVVRNTSVFALEDGVWRLIQVHNSNGRANEEVLGVSLTNTLDELLRSVQRDDRAVLDDVADRGTATLVFTDIQDSTSTAASVGDSTWSELIAWHDTVIADVTKTAGGEVVKTLGDGALLSFNTAGDAARAAMEIQRRVSSAEAPVPIAVRIGVHSGDVIRTTDDVLGTTVNVAARVASAATGGEVLASSVVYGMLADTPGFEFGEPRQVELKGLRRVHTVIPILWQGRSTSTPAP